MNKKILILVTVLSTIFLSTGCFFSNSKKYSASDFKDPEQYELAKAIMKKNVKKVEDLAPKTDLHSVSAEGMSLLMLATLEVVHDVKNNNKNSEPLYEIVTILMKAGADATQSQAPPGNKDTIRPISYTWLGDEVPAELLKAMLDGGLDPNYIFIRENRQNPLILQYLSEGKFEKLKLLVEAGANIDTNVDLTSTIPCPIVYEAAYSSMEATLYLLEQGADPYSKWGDKTLAYSIDFELNRYSKIKAEYEAKNKTNDEIYKMTLARLDAAEKSRDILIRAGVKWPPDMPESVRKNKEKQKRNK